MLVCVGSILCEFFSHMHALVKIGYIWLLQLMSEYMNYLIINLQSLFVSWV